MYYKHYISVKSHFTLPAVWRAEVVDLEVRFCAAMCRRRQVRQIKHCPHQITRSGAYALTFEAGSKEGRKEGRCITAEVPMRNKQALYLRTMRQLYATDINGSVAVCTYVPPEWK
jgi:hypothetical protein